MKIRAVRGRLPDGAVVGFGIVNSETQNRAVGRPVDIGGGAASRKQKMRLTAVGAGDVNLVPFAKSDLFAIGRPSAGVAFEDSEAARRTANHGDAPKRAVERSSAGGIHEERGAVWRDIEDIGKACVFERVRNGKGVAARDGSLGESGLSLDEVEAGAIRDHVRFWTIGVGELDGSQYAWRRDRPQRHVAQNDRESDESANDQGPSLPSRGRMVFAHVLGRVRYGDAGSG